MTWLVMLALIFGAKYVLYGEWMLSDMNMKVPLHAKNVGLNKKNIEGFVFGSGSGQDKKKVGSKHVHKGKNNLVSSAGKEKC